MIQISDLSKKYGQQLVLANINLNIARGEIHGLLGSSGAGKSTLLRCINGLEPYDSGSLKVFGQEVKTLSGTRLHEFRKKIGMIFQDFALLERKTVLENILLPMECWHYPKAEMQTRAKDLLDLVGIADKAAARPAELSGGQKQRVAIARTLTLRPEIVLCDEATSALDPLTTKSVLQLLKSINSSLNITMLVVTHQMSVVKDICTSMSIVENGGLSISGTVSDIFTHEPQALQRLTGTPEITVPEGQSGFKIALNHQQSSQPFFSDLVSNLKLECTVLYTRTDICTEGKIEHFYLAVPQKTQGRLCAYLDNKNICFSLLESSQPIFKNN
jgi:D-methionine transport system ATP-binding protein